MLIRVLPLVFVATVTAAVHAQQQPPLTPDEIDFSIQAGKDGNYDHMQSSCVASAGFGEGLFATGVVPIGSYSVTVAGPAGAIAADAAHATRLYKPFTAADVTPEMAALGIYLSAYPYDPDRSGNAIHVASPIQAIVLKEKDGDVAIQPASLEMEPVQWSNLLGGTVDGTSASATFSFDDFLGLPAGEIDIVLITAAGERRCKIGRDDRAMLSHPGIPER